MLKSNEELCFLIQQGKNEYLEELISQNEKLLYSLINRFKVPYNEKEDVFTCAKIGLIKAAQNYKSEYNTVFSTYAVSLILGEIKKYFRDNSSLHVSRGFKELFSRCVKAQEILENELQKSVSLKEIAEYLNESFEDILMAYESHFSSLSLDAPFDEDDNCLGDIIPSKNNQEMMELNMALSTLNKKEQLIIKLRYFDGLTQQEVASRLFISQVQISRLEKKILEKLKVNM